MARHRGFIVKPVNGRWQARAKRPGIKGSYETRSFDDEEEAKTWARRRHAELILEPEAPRGPKPPRAPRPDTKAIGERMLVHMEEDGLSEGQIGHHRRMLAQIAGKVPDLAAPAVSQILRAWLNSRPLAANTYNRHLMQLRRLVRWAKAERLLDEDADPLRGIKTRRSDGKLKSQFTLDQLRHLLRQGADHFWLPFALLIYTGARVGEALTIRWEDIEWNARGGARIVFRRRPGRKLKTGERITPVPDELAAILVPLARASGPVTGVSLRNINKRFNAFLAAYGLADRDLTPHSCRHTYIGLMTATGEPAGVVRLYVGHSDEAMTHHYAEEAARFRAEVDDWKRGELRLMEGIASPWPKPAAEGKAAKATRSLRTGGKFTGRPDSTAGSSAGSRRLGPCPAQP